MDTIDILEILVTSSSTLILILVVYQFGQMFNWYCESQRIEFKSSSKGGLFIWLKNNLHVIDTKEILKKICVTRA